MSVHAGHALSIVRREIGEALVDLAQRGAELGDQAAVVDKAAALAQGCGSGAQTIDLPLDFLAGVQELLPEARL